MTTHTRRVKVSVLDDRIDILNRNAADASPAQQVYRTVGDILALVRNKLIDNEDSMQLSEYCFNVCETLKATVLRTNADDPNDPVSVALKDLGRFACEIERTLKRGVSSPHSGYNKEKIEGYKLEIQQVLGILDTPSTPLDENSMVSPAAQDRFDSTATTSVAESAVWCLIKRAFSLADRSSLIESVFSSEDWGSMVRSLSGEDAQSFIDVIDEALLDVPDLSPPIQKKCLRSLYRTCGRHALLPTPMKILVWYDRMGSALYRGGFADVWKGEHCGRDVAVKVLRTYTNGDLQKVIGRFCKEVVTWRTLRHPNVLPLIGVMMTETQFAMVSDWMENGNINEFVKANPDANRLELLGDAATGLIYIHSQGMIHGDLKGANVLVDQTGHARIADFGLLTIISDPANLLSSTSYIQGGTARWMSPELIAPQKFGLETSRPTKSSDCYALGMVIYETISGNLPFHKYTDLTIFVKVLEGERPPRAAGFADSLWEMSELCWDSQPSARPNIEDVLQSLERVSRSWEPPSPGIHKEANKGVDSDSLSDTSVYNEPLHTQGRPGPSGLWTAEPSSPNDRHDRYRYLVDTNLLQDLNHIAQPSAGPLTSVAGAYILKEFMKRHIIDLMDDDSDEGA